MPDLSEIARQQQVLLRGRPGRIEIPGEGVFTRPIVMEFGQDVVMGPGFSCATDHNFSAPPPYGFGYGIFLPKGNNTLQGSGPSTVIQQPRQGTVFQPWQSTIIGQTPHFNMKCKDIKVIGHNRAGFIEPNWQDLVLAATQIDQLRNPGDPLGQNEGWTNKQSGVIMLGNCTNGEVSGCTLVGTHSMGIVSGGGAVAGTYGKNHKILNNTIVGGFPKDFLGASVQIAVVNTATVLIQGNTMSRLGAAGACIDLEPNGSESRAEDVLVISNQMDIKRRHPLQSPADIEMAEGYWNLVSMSVATFSDGIKVQQGAGDARNLKIIGNTISGGFDMGHSSLIGIHINGRKNREFIIADNNLENWHATAMDINGHHGQIHGNILRDISTNAAMIRCVGRKLQFYRNMIHAYRYPADCGWIEEVAEGADGWTDHNTFDDNVIEQTTNGGGGWFECGVRNLVGPNSRAGGKANPNRPATAPDTWDYSKGYAAYPSFWQP